MSQLQDRVPSQLRPGQVDLAVVTAPTAPVAEAYRTLRSSVKFADVTPPIHSLAIADSGTGGQHAVVAANLAAAFALGGDTVALIDAVLREPRLHQLLGVSNEQGLSEWLARGDVGQPLPLVETALPGLRLLPAGHAPAEALGASPIDLLGSDACAALLTRLRDEVAYVVIDTSPLPEYGDALALAPRVDGVLLLVRSGHTKRAAAQRAKEALDRVGARVLGAVLTDTGRGVLR